MTGRRSSPISSRSLGCQEATTLVVVGALCALAVVVLAPGVGSFPLPHDGGTGIPERTRRRDLVRVDERNFRLYDKYQPFEEHRVAGSADATPTIAAFKLPQRMDPSSLSSAAVSKAEDDDDLTSWLPRLVGGLTLIWYTLVVWCTIGIALLGLTFPSHLYIVPR